MYPETSILVSTVASNSASVIILLLKAVSVAKPKYVSVNPRTGVKSNFERALSVKENK